MVNTELITGLVNNTLNFITHREITRDFLRVNGAKYTKNIICFISFALWGDKAITYLLVSDYQF